MSDRVQCPQCAGHGCGWCHHRGWLTYDEYRLCVAENRGADDDRDWARERDRRSGAYSG